MTTTSTEPTDADQAPTTSPEAAEPPQNDENPADDPTPHLDRIAALDADLAAARADLDTARADLARWQVGAALGLPETLIGRLTGDTRDQLEADAKALIAAVRPTGPTAAPPRALLPGWTTSQEPPAPPADPIRDALQRAGMHSA